MRKAATLMAIAMLAACDRSGGGNGRADAAPGAPPTPGRGEPTAAVTLLPGQWESRLEFLSMNPPPAPGTAPDMRPVTDRYCVSPGQAANPSSLVSAARDVGFGCTNDFSWVGGRIFGSQICRDDRSTSRVTISGLYTATTYEITMRSRTESGGSTIDVESKVTARRIGDCPPGEAAGGNSAR